jgi:cytochrome c oxidase assembly protein subunit 15
VKRIYEWLPSRIDGRVRVIAWVYLAAQILLVGTGGLVRLTSSGLGCPSWPQCSDESLINTPELGVHGVIEFGNRLLGVALGLLAIVAFLAVLRVRKQRPDLFWLTLIAGFGIPAQAVVGGISVLSKLNPYVVGIHFVISVVLVCLCTTFVHRVYTGNGPRVAVVPAWYSAVAMVAAVVTAVTILVGILTTGSGPHAGDVAARRNGLDPELLQHVHSWPAYVTLALTVLLVVAALRFQLPVRRWVLLLLLVELAQIAVGLLQARTGLPPFIVGVHLVLACVLAAVMMAVLLNLRMPVLPAAADPVVAPSASAARK